MKRIDAFEGSFRILPRCTENFFPFSQRRSVEKKKKGEMLHETYPFLSIFKEALARSSTIIETRSRIVKERP